MGKHLTWIFILVLFVGCQQHDKQFRTADLTGLVSGDGKDTDYQHIHAEKENTFVRFTSDSSAAFISFSPHTINLPDSWKNYEHLQVSQKNESAADTLTLVWKIYGSKNILLDTLILSPGERLVKNISLVELPLANRRKDFYKVEKIVLEATGTIANASFTVEKIDLIAATDSISEPVVDRFGQRLHANWPYKVKSIGQLVESRMNEEKNFNEHGQLDTFGGLKTYGTYQATGFFRLEQSITKQDTIWWFVTPEGNPFWSLGVTCIRPKYPRTAVTKVKEFEDLFKKLPETSGTEGQAYIGDSLVSFYYWNLIRKYGSIDDWHETMFKRLRYWGLNTIGNWSVKEILLKSEIPFTYSFRTTENKKYSFGHGMNDVFAPGWQKHVEDVFKEAGEFKENPYLIGYFVDNEGGWGNLHLLEIMPQECETRVAWLNLVKSRYGSLQQVNSSWNADFQTWKEVKNMQPLTEKATSTYLVDVKEFERLYANKYFSVIKNTLNLFDPNHLYLGCRFTKRLKPAHILEEAGKFCDVITVNVYDLVPKISRMDKWHELTGRPILIGEHHLPLKSNRQLPPHYPAFTATERLRYYQEYVKTWAEQPYALGCHWYQLSDQHITGRYSNGENQVIGLVDITDQPYPELVEAMQRSSSEMYRWHEQE